MIMIELEALNWSFQLLLYIYNMISGMSRADVKTSFSSYRGSDIPHPAVDKNILGIHINEKTNTEIATCAESDNPIVTFKL